MRTCAQISSGLTSFPSNLMRTSPFLPFTTSYGTESISSFTSSNFLPINLFAEKIVPAGLVIACLFAGVPTMILLSL
jgi:hypothetical protein